MFAAIAAVCVATAPSPSRAAIVKYRAAPEYVYGTYNEANPASSTKLTTTATLAFPNITLDDIVRFSNERMARKTRRYMILGNEKELDMAALQQVGPVKRVSLEDIFGY